MREGERGRESCFDHVVNMFEENPMQSFGNMKETISLKEHTGHDDIPRPGLHEGLVRRRESEIRCHTPLLNQNLGNTKVSKR